MARKFTPAKRMLDAVPRLVRVTNRAAISFSIVAGLDQITSERMSEDVSEAVGVHRFDSASMTVLRLAILLDPNPRTLSYQSIHEWLQGTEAVAEITRRVRLDARLLPYPDVGKAVHLFRTGYERINWERYERLKTFRHQGVAHLDPNGITTRVRCEDLRRLVYSVVALGEALAPLTDVVPVRKDEIAGRTKQATETWRAIFGAPSCGL